MEAQDNNPQDSMSISAGQDANIEGDVVGRDKVINVTNYYSENKGDSGPKAELPESDIPPQVMLDAKAIGKIEIQSGPSKGLNAFITEQTRRIIVGRGGMGFTPGIRSDDKAMSRWHFEITIVPIVPIGKAGSSFRVQLTDLQSANGTFLVREDQTIMVRGAVDLKNGDIIRAGGTRFEVHLFQS